MVHWLDTNTDTNTEPIAGHRREISESLAATPAAVRIARRTTEAALRVWDLDQLTDDVTLVVSELVTNAVRAAADDGEVRLALFRLPLYVGVEVHDRIPEPPERRCPGEWDVGGRGLLIVDALAERWDVHFTDQGKAVCALIRIAGRHLP